MCLFQGKTVLNKFKEIVEANPQIYNEDYLRLKEEIAQSPLRHGGLPIRFIYNPLFFSKQEINLLDSACNQLAVILDKVTQEYLRNKNFRQAFGFSQELEELILIDPGYGENFPMARFDIFYDFDTGSLKFCELNADGSSGMTKSLLLDEKLSQSKPTKIIRNDWQVTYLNPVDSWIEALLENYANFRGTGGKPTIAIMDVNCWKQGMVTEFQEFQRKLKEQGYTAVICDPRELKFREEKLYFHDKPVDLIYRRAVTSDLLEIYAEIADLVEAVKKKAVCLVGAFRSQIIHNKKIFALLHNSQLTDFLRKEEQEFIKKFIPFTQIFTEKIKPEILKNRERWVLKPLDSYQSQGVYIGRDYTWETWQEIVNNIPPGEYLVQEFVEVPKLELVDFREGKLVKKNYNQMIGLFMYNKKFSGFYTRVSPLNNVASGLGAVAVANLICN